LSRFLDQAGRRGCVVGDEGVGGEMEDEALSNAGSGEGRSECVGIWAAIRSDVLRKLEPLRVAEMVPWAPQEGRGGYPGPVWLGLGSSQSGAPSTCCLKAGGTVSGPTASMEVMAPTDRLTHRTGALTHNPPRPAGQRSGAQARDVKGLRPDPLRGLTSAPAPLGSQPGRGAGK